MSAIPAWLPTTAMAIVLALSSRTATAASMECVDFMEYSSWIGKLNVSGDLEQCELVGNDLYVTANGGGVRIFDVSDPDHPEYSSGILTPARDLAVIEEHVIVASGQDGVVILVVQHPTGPQPVGSVATPGDALAVALRTPTDPTLSKAYVACGDAGLVIVDFEDETAPEVISQLDTPGTASDVVVVGDFAYLADGPNGLLVIDISNPSAPLTVGSVPGVSTTDVAHSVGFIYGTGPSSTIAVDVSVPTDPHVTHTIPLAGLDVVSSGHRLIIGGNPNVHVLDRSNPGEPIEIGSIVRGPSPSKGLAWMDDRVFVCAGTQGLETVRIGSRYEAARSLFFPERVDIGFVRDPWLILVMSWSRDIRTFDMADPGSPTLVGVFVPPHPIGTVGMEDDLLYLISGDTLQIYDFSSPWTPSLVGELSVDLGNYPRIEIAEGFVHVCDQIKLTTIDVSDPTNPHLVTSSQFPTNVFGAEVARSGNLLYVAVSALQPLYGLFIYDVTIPESALLLGSKWFPVPPNPFNWYAEIELMGDTVWFSTLTPHSPILDVSDPTQPEIMGEIPSRGWAWSASKHGDLAYVSGDAMTVVDVSNPRSPRVLGSLPGPGDYIVTVGSEDYIVVGESYRTWITSPHCLEATGLGENGPFIPSVQLSVKPNPVRSSTASVSFMLDRPGEVALSIYDLAGRRVRILEEGRFERGRLESIWDARDEDGSRVASGVYFVRLEVDGHAQSTARAVLIR